MNNAAAFKLYRFSHARGLAPTRCMQQWLRLHGRPGQRPVQAAVRESAASQSEGTQPGSHGAGQWGGSSDKLQHRQAAAPRGKGKRSRRKSRVRKTGALITSSGQLGKVVRNLEAKGPAWDSNMPNEGGSSVARNWPAEESLFAQICTIVHMNMLRRSSVKPRACLFARTYMCVLLTSKRSCKVPVAKKTLLRSRCRP